MTRLSVNVNKIALLRNSRGGNRPSVVEAAEIAIAAGCHGITIHPRIDSRHATLADIAALMDLEPIRSGRIELNVEGDLRDDLLRAAKQAGAHQFTVVPVAAGEITSNRGWNRNDDCDGLRRAIAFLGPRIRVSLFVNATAAQVEMAAELGVQAVEFYTADYAHAHGTGDARAELRQLADCAALARKLRLRVHIGHDLDTANLPDIIAALAPDEASIGHGLISDAVLLGLPRTVSSYLQAMRKNKRSAA
ncbi:MAG: pyridoxine 5'-phosphate synthase [Dongiaceae bacterium]